MLSEELKIHTQESHQKLEKLLVGKMKSISSADDYVHILNLFYGYFGALEVKINALPVSALLPDYEQRRKTESLLQDIQSLSGKTSGQSGDKFTPTIDSTLQALGALYVIEGSTLGGPIISKMISSRLQKDDSTGFSFFKSYGDESPAMWTAFKHVLDTQQLSEQEQQEVPNAAEQTFEGFTNWIKSSESDT